jgi:hypothetical protein
MRRLGRAVRRPRDATCADANERVRALGPEPRILTAEQAKWLEQLTAIDSAAVGEVDAAKADFSRARTIAEQQGLEECALLGRVDR